MEEVSAGRALTHPKRRFCFALDNVLVTPPKRVGDWTTVEPIQKNVQLVRELKASGHHIIITTSRLMQECGGNVGSVMAACGNQTLRMLESLDIPYDEILHFGQPFAHVYVDASVASASGVDTAKELGWRVTSGPQLEPGMVAARHFNNVQLEGDYVVKTASAAVLRGEIFFYKHAPDIRHLFLAISSFNAAAVRARSAPRRTETPANVPADSGRHPTPRAPPPSAAASTATSLHTATRTTAAAAAAAATAVQVDEPPDPFPADDAIGPPPSPPPRRCHPVALSPTRSTRSRR